MRKSFNELRFENLKTIISELHALAEMLDGQRRIEIEADDTAHAMVMINSRKSVLRTLQALHNFFGFCLKDNVELRLNVNEMPVTVPDKPETVVAEPTDVPTLLLTVIGLDPPNVCACAIAKKPKSAKKVGTADIRRTRALRVHLQ